MRLGVAVPRLPHLRHGSDVGRHEFRERFKSPPGDLLRRLPLLRRRQPLGINVQLVRKKVSHIVVTRGRHYSYSAWRVLASCGYDMWGGSGGASVVYCSSNSHAFASRIILDRDAGRMTKRQKPSHPGIGVLHEAGALSAESQHVVTSRHVGKAKRRQPEESLPQRRNRNGNDKPCAATTTTGGKVGKTRGNLGRPMLRPMVGMLGEGSGTNLTEVCAEPSLFFFLDRGLVWADPNLLGSGEM